MTIKYTTAYKDCLRYGVYLRLRRIVPTLFEDYNFPGKSGVVDSFISNIGYYTR